MAMAAVLTSTVASPAWAQAHDHGATAPTKLSLDHARKWSTDEALRNGMTRIRARVEPQLAAAQGGKLSPAQYATPAASERTR